MTYHGNPCWYELGTCDQNGASAFYGKILGWQTIDAGLEGFTYLLARSGAEMVAGMMPLDAQAGTPPPNWRIYFAVDDCDKAAADMVTAGGQIQQPPADIPGTGRFAILADPQGAGFGVLQPDMSQMTPEQVAKAETTGAFDQKKAGHGNWNELMTSDPEAGFAFYAGQFGWTKGEAMPMGEMGTYQLFRRGGLDIGAVQGLGGAPAPCWLPYFGANGSMTAMVETIKAEGGTVHHGPAEVPGPAWIVIAQDPQGAWFALVGSEK